MGKKEVEKRPNWHSLYMTLCFEIAMRSLDPNTKHGCFIVSSDYSPLSFGFNSPPQGCIDENIPLTAPVKYPFFAHAEQNAIDNAAEKGISIKNSTFYITGFPCPRCFQSIRRVKAKKIIYGPIKSKMILESDMKAIEMLNTDRAGNKIVEMLSFEDIIGDSVKALYEISKVHTMSEKYILNKTGIQIFSEGRNNNV